jgi:hypothetical protein
MIGPMKSSSRLKRGAMAAALFVSGLAAGGLALRSGSSNPVPAAQPRSIQVVHKRKVRTVHVNPSGASGSSAPAPAVAPAPASAPAPTPVSSRTSPGAAGGGGGGEGGEVERGD